MRAVDADDQDADLSSPKVTQLMAVLMPCSDRLFAVFVPADWLQWRALIDFSSSWTGSCVCTLTRRLCLAAHARSFCDKSTNDKSYRPEQGFITAEAGPKGNVSISQLPPGVRLDAPWPLLKVAQQAQPHRLTYYPEARLYALTVSRQVHLVLGSRLRER